MDEWISVPKDNGAVLSALSAFLKKQYLHTMTFVRIGSLFALRS
jgi:hypothetical protein